MTFFTVDSHLLTVFDISNSTQCPIHHSGYLQFNVALQLDRVNMNSYSYYYCIQNEVQSVMEYYAV
jgi:hypothetical protein